MEIRAVEDRINHRRGRMQWIALALLATVAVFLLGAFGLTVRAEPASATSSDNAAGDVQVVAANLGRNTQGLYLVDRTQGTICVYEYVPRERKLKLAAVRRYSFDVQLTEEKLKEAQTREP